MKTSKELAQDYLKNLSERNLDQLTNMFSENVDWYIPGDADKAPWLGRLTTRDKVKSFYEMLWANTEPVSANVYELMANDKTAVITGEFTTKMLQTGKMLNSLFCIQMNFESEKIVWYRLLEDSLAVAEALS